MRPEPKAAQLAEKEGVDIRLYTDHLRSHQRYARSDGRAARADLSREVAGPRRSPPDLRRPGHYRCGRDGDRRQVTAQRARASGARRPRGMGRQDRARCGASRTTRAKCWPATNAVSGWRISTTSSPATSIEDFEMEAVLRKLGDARSRNRCAAHGGAGREADADLDRGGECSARPLRTATGCIEAATKAVGQHDLSRASFRRVWYAARDCRPLNLDR